MTIALRHHTIAVGLGEGGNDHVEISILRQLPSCQRLGNSSFVHVHEASSEDSAGGNGTAGNSYQMADCNHLSNVRDHLDAHFILDESPRHRYWRICELGTANRRHLEHTKAAEITTE